MKANLVFIYFSLSFIFTGNVFAQDVFIIKGSVRDSVNQMPISYATVTLKNKADSVFLKRFATSTDGSFETKLSKAGIYELMIDFIGYKHVNQKIDLNDNQKIADLGVIFITEQSTTLSDIQIIAQKPLVKAEADKLTYDAQADPESKTLNALDLLRKVPLVTVDGEDNIKIKGNGNFKIHINGRPSSIANSNPKEFLRNMQASSIKNIEVITSPGAKYDAEGVGGVLNIITDESSSDGYLCKLNSGVGSTGAFRGGIYFALTKGKFSFSTNISGNYRNRIRSTNETEGINDLNPDLYYTKKTGESFNSGLSSWGNGQASYEIDSLNLFSGSFDFWGGRYESEAYSMTEISNISKIRTQTYELETQNEGLYGGPSANIDFQHISKKNKERFFTISYLFNSNPQKKSNSSALGNILNYTDLQQKSSNTARSSEHTGQIDYVHPLSGKINIETGIKYIFRLNSSRTEYLVFDEETNQFIENIDLLNDFTNYQNIGAYYVSVNTNFEKLSIKIGARIEKSVLNVEFHNTENNNFSNSSFEIVPSASMNYNLTETQSIGTAYTMRIQRPDIWYLNPYVNNIDPQNIRYGNPKLDPERFHNIDLTHNYFGQNFSINTTLSESFSKNAIDEYISIDTNNVVRTTYENINNSSITSFSSSINWKISSKINSTLAGSVQYSSIQSLKTEAQTETAFGFDAYANIQYKLTSDFRISFDVWGFKSPKSLYYNQKLYYSAGLSCTYEFWDKKASISLSVRDVLRKKSVWEFDSYGEGFTKTSRYFNPGRVLQINISYRFGQLDGSVKKVQRGIENDDKKSGGKGES